MLSFHGLSWAVLRNCGASDLKNVRFAALSSKLRGFHQSNYTKHAPRETLNRKGTFSMTFCGLRLVWMVFFVGAFDLRDGDSAQNLGAQIDQK